jgi:hypothetical protein
MRCSQLQAVTGRHHAPSIQHPRTICEYKINIPPALHKQHIPKQRNEHETYVQRYIITLEYMYFQNAFFEILKVCSLTAGTNQQLTA